MKKVVTDSPKNQWVVLWDDMLGKDFWKKFLVLVFIIALSTAATLFVNNLLTNCNANLKLISTDLICDKEYVLNKAEYKVFKAKLSSYIDGEKAAGRILRASVYFRDLDNGPTMGINETDKFIPASLLKVPLAVTYLSIADDVPDILKEKLGFSWETKPALEQFFAPSHTIESGNAYTIDQLLFTMIAYSDNASYYVLLEHLREINPTERDLLFETFLALGIIDPASNLDQSISAKSYASIFRNFFNASYLSKESSEKILELLIASDFDEGLVAGIPAGINVAHKFGERYGINAQGDKELHDCGIIYYPENPYLLCVMTEGPDYLGLSKVIQTVSRMMYTEVQSRQL